MKNQETQEAIGLLKTLISIPSMSRDEFAAMKVMEQFLQSKNCAPMVLGNNVFSVSPNWDPSKPSVLLNSHLDTVPPNSGYTRNPFEPEVENGKLYGLGSNDAGGALVCLAVSYILLRNDALRKFNIAFAATAEEEITGSNGVAALLESMKFKKATKNAFSMGGSGFAIVGEPTLMKMATAERGLLVVDGEAKGIAGHAAREEGVNAVAIALKDINWLLTHSMEKVSPLLGPVKWTPTIINTENTKHNVVPDRCTFTIDCRINELYSHEEVLHHLTTQLSAELTPRSMKLRSSQIEETHPIVRSGRALGLESYGSPTCSDKGLMPFPALKIGPGDSARSHTPDEFIYLDEIEQGISLYLQLLHQFNTYCS